jgi:hypothetical protein
LKKRQTYQNVEWKEDEDDPKIDLLKTITNWNTWIKLWNLWTDMYEFGWWTFGKDFLKFPFGWDVIEYEMESILSVTNFVRRSKNMEQIIYTREDGRVFKGGDEIIKFDNYQAALRFRLDREITIEELVQGSIETAIKRIQIEKEISKDKDELKKKEINITNLVKEAFKEIMMNRKENAVFIGKPREMEKLIIEAQEEKINNSKLKKKDYKFDKQNKWEAWLRDKKNRKRISPTIIKFEKYKKKKKKNKCISIVGNERNDEWMKNNLTREKEFLDKNECYEYDVMTTKRRQDKDGMGKKPKVSIGETDQYVKNVMETCTNSEFNLIKFKRKSRSKSLAAMGYIKPAPIPNVSGKGTSTTTN